MVKCRVEVRNWQSSRVSSLSLELMTFNHSSKALDSDFCDLWHRLSAARLFDLQPRVLCVSDLFTFPDCHQNSRESCRAQEFNDLSRVPQTTLQAHLQQPQNIHYDLNNLFFLPQLDKYKNLNIKNLLSACCCESDLRRQEWTRNKQTNFIFLLRLARWRVYLFS